jgi:hypothetical protein
MPPNPTESILLEIKAIQTKINFLESVLDYPELVGVRIYFDAKDKLGRNHFVSLDQSCVPFNLKQELRQLIEDSANHYLNDIQTLNFKLQLI